MKESKLLRLIGLVIGLSTCYVNALRVATTNIIPGDGIDNDGDGLIDEEYCYNGIDEDDDGLLNEDCAYLEICPRHGSTTGQEFVTLFLDNQPDDSAFNPLQMFIGRTEDGTANGDTSINITTPLLLPLDGYTVLPARTDIKTKIDGRQLGKMVDLPYQLRVTDSDVPGKQRKSIHVHVGRPARVHGYNVEKYTADSFFAIPANALGRDYFALTYVPSLLNTEVAIIGLYTNTTVNVTLMNDLGEPDTPRLMLFYAGFEYENGQSFTINVNPYEIVQITSEYDMTGARFTSDKPFAVFSGNLRTWVRNDASESYIQSRDHLVEQVPPVETYGKRFVTRNYPPYQLFDICRVLASQPNTDVSVRVFNSSGQFNIKFNLKRPGMYRDVWLGRRELASVVATQPVMVGHYTHSQRADHVPKDEESDPSLIYVPSVDQFDTDYIFGSTVYYGTANETFRHYVLLQTKRGFETSITLDGSRLEGVEWAEVTLAALNDENEDTYVQGILSVSDGIHRLKSRNPFGAIQWSVADRESVGTTLGIKFTQATCEKCMQVICGDHVDNDCDGRVDEEQCDGVDNDRDGLIDEDCACDGRKRMIYRHTTTVETPPPTTTRPKPTTPEPAKQVTPAPATPGLCTLGYDEEGFQAFRTCYNNIHNIQCPARRVVSILTANFGRIGYLGETTCGAPNPLNCEADDVACPYIDAYVMAAKTCNGKQSCDLVVNSSLVSQDFRPACRLDATYLDVTYICADVATGKAIPPCSFTPASRWLVVQRDMIITASSYASCLLCSNGDREQITPTCPSGARSQCQPFMATFDNSATEAWCPSLSGAPSSWIQADLGAPYVVLGVILQGRRRLTTQFVREINIQVGTNEKAAFTKISTSASTDRQTFLINKNASDIVWIPFESNRTVARYVRIQVEKYADHPALHFELVINNQIRGCEAFRGVGTSLEGQRGEIGAQQTVTCVGEARMSNGRRAFQTTCQADGQWSMEVACRQ